jgi:hypothetical protein
VDSDNWCKRTSAFQPTKILFVVSGITCQRLSEKAKLKFAVEKWADVTPTSGHCSAHVAGGLAGYTLKDNLDVHISKECCSREEHR